MIEVEPHAATELRDITCSGNLVKFGSVVFDICELTDRHTDIRTDTLIKILRTSRPTVATYTVIRFL